MCDVAKSKNQQNELLAAEFAAGLHELCQPLTVLQGNLEMGLLHDTEIALISATQNALIECVRMNRIIRDLRKLIQAEQDNSGI
jgi:signal transduction histidine kinase